MLGVLYAEVNASGKAGLTAASGPGARDSVELSQKLGELKRLDEVSPSQIQ